MTSITAGARFRRVLADNSPLQIVGTINAFTALLAEKAGFQAIYLSGAGVANRGRIRWGDFVDHKGLSFKGRASCLAGSHQSGESRGSFQSIMSAPVHNH